MMFYLSLIYLMARTWILYVCTDFVPVPEIEWLSVALQNT
jgi:hypothetical protein